MLFNFFESEFYYQPNVYFSRKKQATPRNTMNSILVSVFEAFLLLTPFCKSLTNSLNKKNMIIKAMINAINLSVVNLIFKK